MSTTSDYRRSCRLAAGTQRTVPISVGLLEELLRTAPARLRKSAEAEIGLLTCQAVYAVAITEEAW